MTDSILESTKKNLGIDADYTVFDPDITLHINSVFSTLTQLGIGPVEGFEIEDDTATWSDFLDNDPRLNSVKTYVYLRVRLMFDPPNNGFLVDNMQKQIDELTWRINVTREFRDWPSQEAIG